MTKYLSFDHLYATFIRHTKEFIIGAALIGLCFAGAYAYWIYNNHQQQSAQVALATCLEEYNRAHEDSSVWPMVGLASSTGYRQHSSSSLAPYFLLIEAQSLLGQDKYEEAIQLLDKAIGMIPHHSPLYYLYAIQSARVKITSNDETIKNAGLNELEALSANEKNINRDEALYYLADHYEQQGSFERSKEIFHKLVVAFPEGGLAASPWALLAQEKIKKYSA